MCRVGIFCPVCPEWRRAHVQWPQTCRISEHSVHTERGKSQRTGLSKGSRVWKAAAAISLKWPLTHGLIKLNALAQKCRWMSWIEYESRTHILTHSCIKFCLSGGDSYMISSTSVSFVVQSACPWGCTRQIYLVHFSGGLMALLSICFTKLGRLHIPSCGANTPCGTLDGNISSSVHREPWIHWRNCDTQS